MSATGKLDRPGGSLHFEVIDATPPWAADAPLIVFHHGIGATSDVWAEWLPALLDRYRLARFDMLGFGRSGVPGPGFPWSLEGLMADPLEVARSAGAARFHFVGESVGGTVGLLLGSRDLADVLSGRDLSPGLGRIPVPTLLLAPGRSPFVPLAVMEEMHAGIVSRPCPCR